MRCAYPRKKNWKNVKKSTTTTVTTTRAIATMQVFWRSTPPFSFSYACIRARKETTRRCLFCSIIVFFLSSFHSSIHISCAVFLSVCYSFLSNHQEKRVQSVVAFFSLCLSLSSTNTHTHTSSCCKTISKWQAISVQAQPVTHIDFDRCQLIPWVIIQIRLDHRLIPILTIIVIHPIMDHHLQQHQSLLRQPGVIHHPVN